MQNNFTKYIKAVGTGKKHNHNLSTYEMKIAFEMIFNNEVANEQISAFLLGWRIKPETNEEFEGVLLAFDNYIKRVSIINSIELSYPYDGKKNNPYLFSLIAKQLKNFNINLVICYDELLNSKDSISLLDIVKNINFTNNLYLFNRKEIFKELSNLTNLRNLLSIRTGLNTIEKLLNPASSDIAILGVFHKPYVEKYAKIFKNRYKKLVIVKGNEGGFEIFSKCKYWIIQNNTINEYTINPKDYGINYNKSWNKTTLEKSLESINNPSKELLKIVKLNAAFILYVKEITTSIKEGYNLL